MIETIIPERLSKEKENQLDRVYVSIMEHKPSIVNRIILAVEIGDATYGIQNNDSIKEYSIVYIPKSKDYFGVDEIKDGKIFTYHGGNPVSINIYPIHIFFKKLFDGDLATLETLFAEPGNLLCLSKEGQTIGLNRKVIVSEELASQLHKSADMIRFKVKNAIEVSEEDTKQKLTLATKLYSTAIELRLNGTVIFRPHESYRDLLKDIREDTPSFIEGIELLDNLECRYKQTAQISSIPKESDRELLEKLLVDISHKIIMEDGGDL